MKCLNCKTLIRKNASYCKDSECNKVRCREYYKKTREQQIQRKTKYYFEQKENNYGQLRAINLKAQNKKRFGVSRKVILVRDKYTCQNCKQKKTGKELVVHHRDHNGRNMDNPNNRPENLVTLCQKCHGGHHLGHLRLMI